jgi:adenosylcobinamide kinase/adenosylcobinamide-phosphate guanylyltransferase
MIKPRGIADIEGGPKGAAPGPKPRGRLRNCSFPLRGGVAGLIRVGRFPRQPNLPAMTDAPLPRLTLVLGGARSGKSRYAEELVMRGAPPWTYVATAEALDDEMAARIAHHRARRDGNWRTLDVPLDLAGAVPGLAGATLIDCLTLWLSNVMLAGRDAEAESEQLLAALAHASAPLVVVSNEVGLGLVPETPLGRAFRDAQGRLNQRVAAEADRVVFMAAGLPLSLK